jgi:hypothetical protein
MKATINEVIDGATPAALFEHVATLDRYPAWMRLVHRVTPLDADEDRLAWWVELRAKVGPFARSKQLRMVRTEFDPGRRARFERVQRDDRDHAEWILTAEVTEIAEVANGEGPGAMLSMHLEYTGDLWSAPVLGRILDDEVRRSSVALARLFSGAPTH